MPNGRGNSVHWEWQTKDLKSNAVSFYLGPAVGDLLQAHSSTALHPRPTITTTPPMSVSHTNHNHNHCLVSSFSTAINMSTHHHHITNWSKFYALHIFIFSRVEVINMEFTKALGLWDFHQVGALSATLHRLELKLNLRDINVPGLYLWISVRNQWGISALWTLWIHFSIAH